MLQTIRVATRAANPPSLDPELSLYHGACKDNGMKMLLFWTASPDASQSQAMPAGGIPPPLNSHTEAEDDAVKYEHPHRDARTRVLYVGKGVGENVRRPQQRCYHTSWVRPAVGVCRLPEHIFTLNNRTHFKYFILMGCIVPPSPVHMLGVLTPSDCFRREGL